MNKYKNLIQISNKIQELRGFSLTDHNRLDNWIANLYIRKLGGLGNVDMHMYAKYDKKYTMWFNSYEHLH